MPYRINHIHLKAADPRKTAEWYVKAFAFRIVSDETRVFGDRFVRCQSEDGTPVNISGARTNETLGPDVRVELIQRRPGISGGRC
jgi:catechol 2,3-dioxygenase-like lactoylglutathione lyase family enzyme